MKTQSIEVLDARLKDAGMYTLTEMLDTTKGNPFALHAGVNDIDDFEQWLRMRHEEAMKMKAQMTVDKLEDDELFEWILAHAAALGEVLANFNQAKKGLA